MKLFITILVSVLWIFVVAQEETDPKDLFWNAESHYYDKNYREALLYYQNVYQKGHQDNANINYRIGICHLKGFNKNSEKVKAIPYLEKAVRSTTKDYKEGNFDQTNAHVDAFIYLGDAYLINNNLESAVEAYNEFKTVSETTDHYYLDIVNRKIETCESAKILEGLSIKYELRNLGKNINNNYANYNATMSADGSLLVYTSDMLFYEAIMYAERDKNGDFSIPKNFNIDIQYEGSIRSLCVSADGTELYIFKPGALDGTGNIFVSKRKDGKWGELEKLSINSPQLDRDASISPDGKTLYFTSNRKGGYGSLDIYKATRNENGEWSKPKNLGEKINTQFDEISPCILEDNKTLYFSSQGHTYNIGGADIFMSKMNSDGTWTAPLNFGYPLNTTDDDYYLFPLKEKGKALISLANEEGYGNFDIYEVTFYPYETPQVLLKGKLDNKGKEIDLSVSDNNQNEKTAKTNTEGSFELQVQSGEINIELSADNMEKASRVVDVPLVYCLAEMDISDIELKHTEKLVENPSGQDNGENEAGDHSDKNAETGSDITESTTIEAILFGFNKSIPERYNQNLDKLAKYMNSAGNILIEIQGYTDLQGDAEYNVLLSKRRAEFVKEYLKNRGVDESKMKIRAYGEKNQISKDLTPESRKYNRRVTFKIEEDRAGKLKVLSPDIPEKYKI